MTLPTCEVDDEDFVTLASAGRRLDARLKVSVSVLIARDLPQPAIRKADGLQGVTRQSVEREEGWRQSASSRRKLRRGLGGVVHWL